MLRGSLDRRGVWGRMDTCICIAESVLCPPETITTLLISYTPIQNVTKKKRKESLSVKQHIPCLLCSSHCAPTTLLPVSVTLTTLDALPEWNHNSLHPDCLIPLSITFSGSFVSWHVPDFPFSLFQTE